MNQGRVAVGHPVDVASGAVFTISQDFLLAGTLDLLWRRHYATDSSADTWLGRGWMLPYFMRLDGIPEGYRLLNENGSSLVFPVSGGKLGIGEQVVSLGANLELRRDRHHFSILHWHHPGDEIVRFVFDAENEEAMPLARIENLAGHRIAIAYDPRRRPARITQELEGRTVELSYGTNDLVSAVHFVTEKGARKLRVAYEYDKNRHLVAAIDAAGNRKSYRYDAHHRIVAETNPLGATFTFEYDPQGRCVYATGDGRYMERRLRYLAAPQRTRVTDSLGNSRTYFFNPAGQVIQEVSPLGAATTTQYDEYGRRLQVTNPDGTSVRYGYDGRGNRETVIHEDGSESKLVFNELHRMTESTDPTGAKWTYEYDRRGLRMSLANPLGGRIAWKRDPRGLVIEVRSPGGAATTQRYGPGFRWLEIADSISLINRIECDELGNQTAYFDAEGLLQRVSFNDLNQPIRLTDAGGQAYHYTYNPLGAPLEYHGPGGDWSRWEYDRFGELISRANAAGAIRLEYDTEGNLVAVVNRSGERMGLFYDADGRVVEESSFDGRVQRYEYDLSRRLTQVTRSDGRTVTLRYGKTGFLEARESSDGSRHQYVFDAAGRLVGAQNPSGVLELERNALGRVVAEVQNGRRIEYQQDPDGNRIGLRIDDAGCGPLSMTYDRRGRMITLSDGEGLFQELRWDNLNRLAQRRAPGGVVEVRTYDPLRRLREQRVSSPAEALVVDRRYEYDVRGNVSAQDDRHRGRVEYQYDAVDRLVGVSVDGQPTEFYRYDPNGTILETHRGKRRVAPGGRTLDDGLRQLEYDAAGSVAVIRSPQDELRLTYSVDGQVTRIERPDGSAIVCAYDALGRRISKEDGETRTEFLWSGCELAAELRGGSIADTWFCFGWEPLGRWQGSQRSTTITGEGRALREVLGARGDLLWRCTLDAYGNLVGASGPAANPLRFRGQYHDDETGFHDNFARSYDPRLCQYLSPDPLGLRGGVHPYAYPRNPLLWDDPLGLTCAGHTTNAQQAQADMDAHMASRGYDRMPSPSGASPHLNANGIDGVYSFNPSMAPPGHTSPPPPPQYIIGEAKSGSARLGNTMNSGQQMSDRWIDSPVRPGSGPSRLESAVGATQANNINTAAATPVPAGSPPNVQKEVFSAPTPGSGSVTRCGAYTQSPSSTF